jgi:Cu(I)/Ag(I) efflux system membrane fusion protein
VIVSLGDGRFQVRPVTAGMESGQRVEILAGLHKGDKVVSSGQFLIDSEANLEADLQRLSSPEKSQSTHSQH